LADIDIAAIIVAIISAGVSTFSLYISRQQFLRAYQNATIKNVSDT
jgi:hypothetical protein